MNLIKFRKNIEEIGSTLKPDEDWMPALILEKQDKMIIVELMCMGNDEQKDIEALLITKIISSMRPDAACFVSTCWSLKMDPKDPISEAQYHAGLIRPSTHPNRVEVVMCLCVGERGESEGEAMMGTIERSKHKPPKIKKWENMPDVYQSEGRFIEAMRAGFKPQPEEGEEWKTL